MCDLNKSKIHPNLIEIINETATTGTGTRISTDLVANTGNGNSISPSISSTVNTNPNKNTRVIAAPVRRRYYLVFDVETTGLLPSSAGVPIKDHPHILQLSYVIYDMDTRSIIRTYNSYVKIGEEVVISDFVRELTGITREKCEGGNDIIDILSKFYEAYILCDCLVAHNMDFDTKLILIEIERNKERVLALAPYCFTLFNTINENVRNLQRYCTMKKGTALCNILVDKGNGRPPSKKWPRLVELYSKLFDGQVPEGLHDSMVDTMACLKCFLKMRHNIE